MQCIASFFCTNFISSFISLREVTASFAFTAHMQVRVKY